MVTVFLQPHLWQISWIANIRIQITRVRCQYNTNYNRTIQNSYMWTKTIFIVLEKQASYFRDKWQRKQNQKKLTLIFHCSLYDHFILRISLWRNDANVLLLDIYTALFSVLFLFIIYFVTLLISSDKEKHIYSVICLLKTKFIF